ncbi:MAG TPA: aminotransferase class IV, partial [Pyrinomonadaceae bacterium]|nr:aminotransferase class IV [Pyrinomonadaceae bacterium]
VEFQLFESLLLEDGEYFLLARHLERLRDSAEFFGFVFNEEAIRSALERIDVDGKVRLTLWKDGRIETEVSAIEPFESRRVALATEAIDSSNRFLFHKTTMRPYSDDIIFWNERGEITESTIANVVVSIDGELYTPPVESGLLAGTFRNQLLAQGKIKERVITIEELKNADEFFLINSVRKWMKAQLTGLQD